MQMHVPCDEADKMHVVHKVTYHQVPAPDCSLSRVTSSFQDSCSLDQPSSPATATFVPSDVTPPRYYYNKWMTNRIHTALLDLHLGGSLIGGGQLEAPSSEQLLTAAEAAADTPAIAEAAAAAGFFAVAPHAAIAAGAGDTLVPFQQHPEQMPILQLAKPVLDKLLTLDAGDLDLMIKHPIALQAQVGARHLKLSSKCEWLRLFWDRFSACMDSNG